MEQFTVHDSQGPNLPETAGNIGTQGIRRYDLDYGIGLGCLLLNFLVFYYTVIESLLDGAFIIPWSVAVLYSIWLMNAGKLRWCWKKQRLEYLHHRLLLGYVWLVSCFALNRVMPIFSPSATWLMFAIVIAAASAILFTWEEYLPLPLKFVLFALVGCSAVIWGYYAFILTPYNVLGIPGLLCSEYPYTVLYHCCLQSAISV